MRLRLLMTAVVGLVAPGAVAGADLQGDIDRAIRQGARELRLPAGVHRIGAPLRVLRARGLSIDARGVRLVVTQPTAGALRIERSRAVSVQGLHIDYDPLPFTQGRLVAVDAAAGTYGVDLDPGYVATPAQFPGALADIHPLSPSGLRPLARGGFVAGGRIGAGGTRQVRWTAPRQVDMRFYDLRVGDRVALSARWTICAVQLVDSQSVRLSGLRVAAAPGCGVGETRGGGSRIRTVIRPGPPPAPGSPARLLSTNRDGIHSSGAWPGPAIEASELRETGDDGINVEYRLTRVSAVSGLRVDLGEAIAPFAPGDRVVGYDPVTLRPSVSGRVRRRSPGALTLDRVGALAPGHWLVATRYAGGARIRSTTIIRPGRCGVLVRGPGSRVEGNRVIDAAVCGIWVGGELGGFHEGDFPRGVVVTGNRLTRIGADRSTIGDFQPLLGAITVAATGADSPAGYRAWQGARPITGVRVVANTVRGTGLYGVFVSGARDVDVCGNTLRGVHAQRAPSAGKLFELRPAGAVGVRDAAHVRIGRNVIDTAAAQIDATADTASITTSAACPASAR